MYKRIVRLEARLETDQVLEAKPFFVSEGLRITFQTDIGFAQALAESRVTIYNLGNADSLALLTSNHTASDTGSGEDNKTSKRVNIRLFAGYLDELTEDGLPALLLDGWVMNGASTKIIPEHVTELYVLPRSAAFLAESFKGFNTRDKGRTVAESDTLEEAITRMCEDAGYTDPGSIEFHFTEKMSKERMGNQTIMPHPKSGLEGALSKLSGRYKFEHIGTTKGIAFYPQMETSETGLSAYNHLVGEGRDELTKVLPQRLHGTPITGMMTMEIPYMLSPELRPGFIIDTTNLQGGERPDKSEDGGDKGNQNVEEGQGLNVLTGLGSSLYYDNSLSKYAILKEYMLFRVVHQGDNYGGQWSSTLYCGVPTSGPAGNGES